jgi:hypothetical protein
MKDNGRVANFICEGWKCRMNILIEDWEDCSFLTLTIAVVTNYNFSGDYGKMPMFAI